MNGIYSYVIVIPMYSKILMSTVEWTQGRVRYVIYLFPTVRIMGGLVVGVWFCAGLDVLGFAPWTAVLVGTCVPVLVTEGVHMDGFLDTMDALHSYSGRPKKPEILRDPHLGAFTVVSTAVYMMLYLGTANEYAPLLAPRQKGAGMVLYAVSLLPFMTERALNGLSMVWLPSAKKDRLAAGFVRTSRKKLDRLVLALWLVLCTTLAATTYLIMGREAEILAVSVGEVQLLVLGWYYRMSVKEFGGITGDLAGCFLQIYELASLWVLVMLVRTGGFVL